MCKVPTAYESPRWKVTHVKKKCSHAATTQNVWNIYNFNIKQASLWLFNRSSECFAITCARERECKKSL